MEHIFSGERQTRKDSDGDKPCAENKVGDVKCWLAISVWVTRESFSGKGHLSWGGNSKKTYNDEGEEHSNRKGQLRPQRGPLRWAHTGYVWKRTRSPVRWGTEGKRGGKRLVRRWVGAKPHGLLLRRISQILFKAQWKVITLLRKCATFQRSHSILEQVLHLRIPKSQSAHYS